MKIYVAASAAPDQSARVAHVIAVLRAAGHTITCTWPEVVAATPGGSNPRDASDSARRGWSTQDLVEIDAADALLFLVPPPPQTTRGAWYESGYADKGGKRVVFAGDTKQSVFCARGEEYADDVDAIASLTASRSLPQANAEEANPAGGDAGPRSCSCNPPCPFLPCPCGEDHGSCPGGLCRDCYRQSLFREIDEAERRNPGSFAKRCEEVARLLGWLDTPAITRTPAVEIGEGE